MDTMDVPNLGDAAYESSDYGIETLVVLSGCVELEISTMASLDEVAALAQSILTKL
jgi:hypothetical protein